MSRVSVAALLLAVTACSEPGADAARHDTVSFIAPAGQAADAFPAPQRAVAAIVSPRWATEDERDRAGEADRVIAALGIGRGMTVADIGAGEGYYEPHLSKAVGPTGTVIAQDIVPETLAVLARRVDAAKWHNVMVARGQAHDPRLPPRSVDVALLVHMYHEIDAPFALLWNLRAALKPGGRVAIVDAARPTANHGTPPALLTCELAAVGYRQTSTQPLGDGIYLTVFTPAGPLPAPASIAPCATPA